MSVIGMPSLAFLLVLTNFALCLSVDQQRYTSDIRRPTSTVLSAPPLAVARDVKPSDRPDGAALTAIVPLRTD